MTKKSNLIERQLGTVLVRMDQLKAAIIEADAGLEEEWHGNSLEDVKFQFDRVLRAVTKVQETAGRKNAR